jgi:hypothetical protein
MEEVVGEEVGEEGMVREEMVVVEEIFNSERRLFFVIPLVISADIRTQKMWVREWVR